MSELQWATFIFYFLKMAFSFRLECVRFSRGGFFLARRQRRREEGRPAWPVYLGEALEGPWPGGYVGIFPSGQRPLKLPWLTHS